MRCVRVCVGIFTMSIATVFSIIFRMLEIPRLNPDFTPFGRVFYGVVEQVEQCLFDELAIALHIFF